jgi:hypothetical protein
VDRNIKKIILLVFILFNLESIGQNNNDQNTSNEILGIEFSIAPFAHTSAYLFSPFSLTDMFTESGTNYSLNLTKIAQKSTAFNALQFGANMQWINMQVNYNNTEWKFSISDKVQNSIGFQKSMFNFLNLGNKPFIGQNIEFSIPLSFIHFRTYSFGWGKLYPNNFEFKLYANFYTGKSVASISPSFKLFTQQNLDFLEFELEGEGKNVLPIIFDENNEGFVSSVVPDFEINSYLLGIKNPGVGLSFEFTYQLNNNFVINAAVNDLGFINWKDKGSQINLDGRFNWKGIDISSLSILQPGSSDSTTNNGFKTVFLNQLISSNPSSFYTLTPVSIFADVRYNYSNALQLGVINRLQFFDQFIHNYFSVYGEYLVTKELGISTGLSFTNQTYFNIPVVVSYTSKHFAGSLGMNNMWSLFLPHINRNLGGCINLSYRFSIEMKKRTKEIKSDINYPYYQKRERINYRGKIF